MREWSRAQRQAVERKLLEILEGVGDTSAEHWELGSRALHYRRPMTAAEAAALPRPPRVTAAEKRRARARMDALEALGLVREADVEETRRTTSS